MAKLFGLTAHQQQRVGRAVRDFERRAPEPQDAASGTSSPSPTFWAKLTGEGPSTPGRYSFEKHYPQGFGLVPANPPIIEVGFVAQEVNQTGGMVGDFVELTFVGYDDSTPPKPVYYFNASSAIPVFQYPGMGWFCVANNQMAGAYPFAVQTV